MVIERLGEYGFTNAQSVGTDKNKTIMRIRTSNGWVYDRFADNADVDRWAANHEPEVTHGD